MLHHFLIGKGYTCTYTWTYSSTTGTVASACVLVVFEMLYVHTRVPVHVCIPWYQVRVRTYVLIMLCHNFLIGKGHTCALRTTCVLGVHKCTMARVSWLHLTSWVLVFQVVFVDNVNICTYHGTRVPVVHACTMVRTRVRTYVPWYVHVYKYVLQYTRARTYQNGTDTCS